MLETSLGELGKCGRANAKAEGAYRVALAKKILVERDKGTPVTIISDICRGDRGIAELKFRRDVAEVMYQVALETINVYKIEARQIEAQIEREWKG